VMEELYKEIESAEVCEAFMKHHTGERKMSDSEVFNACYQAGRVIGRHNKERIEIYEEESEGSYAVDD
jgi:hypothetical protein